MPRTAPPELSSDTKTALLDAAERLFAQHGFRESSLRAITSEAQANLASVNYHFGSKDGLVRAVFARRIRPLNRQRLELLETYTAERRGRPRLRSILEAFIVPAMTMMRSEDPGARDFVRILGQSLADSSSELRAQLVAEFEEVFERFTAELARALPGLSPQEIAWRFHFMVGALAHTLTTGDLMRELLQSRGLEDPDESEILTSRLAVFLESGWRSPATHRQVERRSSA